MKTISISDEDFALLRDVAPDPKVWLRYVIEANIQSAIAERRKQPGWVAAAVSFANTGGDPEDGRAVLRHGLATGALKDAAARYAAAKNEAMLSIPE